MPYIKENDREYLDTEIDMLDDKLFLRGYDPGHINYVFTRILHYAWREKPRYLTAALLIGTTICVVLEFYRRVISGYEDDKIKENGDL